LQKEKKKLLLFPLKKTYIIQEYICAKEETTYVDVKVEEVGGCTKRIE